MLSVQLQKVANEGFEKIVRESLISGPNSIKPHINKGMEECLREYMEIREMVISYPFKHSLLTQSGQMFPCNSLCNPMKANEEFISERRARGMKSFSPSKTYTDIGGSFNNICFPRCGDCITYPSCDKKGSIDVRLLSRQEEFDKYYNLRPQELLQKDIDIHPESVRIHQALLGIFESIGDKEIAGKIASVI